MFLRSVMPSPAGSSTVFGLLDPEDDGTTKFFRNSCSDFPVDTFQHARRRRDYHQRKDNFKPLISFMNISERLPYTEKKHLMAVEIHGKLRCELF